METAGGEKSVEHNYLIPLGGKTGRTKKGRFFRIFFLNALEPFLSLRLNSRFFCEATEMPSRAFLEQ